MIRLTQHRWFRRAAFGTVAAIGLGAALLPSVSAQAQGWVDVGGPGYYAAPAPYDGPYGYAPYGYAYDYPSYGYYGYPTGSAYFGVGAGPHWRR
jgi:hypothetical protein